MTVAPFPPAYEAEAIAPAPGTITWERASDVRLVAASGYALLLQVGHPTVAAGVREHSDYQSDPWTRLFRTLDFLNLLIYGGREGSATAGRQVREMHKRIKGTAPDGRRYHALEPEAYAWVHATLLESIVTGHTRFGRPMSAEQLERFYREWRSLGFLAGVRERDLPEDWTGFRAYVQRMVAERLEHSDVVEGVLETISRPAAPPAAIVPGPVWRAVQLPLAHVFRLATVGLLSPQLRERFGLAWTRRQEIELRTIGRASRAATPLMPGALRRFGPRYLRLRRAAIERGEFAGGSPASG